MARFTAPTDMDTHAIKGSQFKFSAAKIGNLGATEYTIATVVVDGSGSVVPFWNQIKKMLQEIARGLRRSPRADNMLLRVIVFDQMIHEIHGFKPLADCSDADYAGLTIPGGTTALYDATYSAVRAEIEYGRQLVASQYSVNGVVVVITDGNEFPPGNSTATKTMCAAAMAEARSSETLESIVPILVGVNTGSASNVLHGVLADFKTEAGFQQYVAIEAAGEKEIAKLAGFVVSSVSSQSQALGTGGPSKSITF